MPARSKIFHTVSCFGSYQIIMPRPFKNGTAEVPVVVDPCRDADARPNPTLCKPHSTPASSEQSSTPGRRFQFPPLPSRFPAIASYRGPPIARLLADATATTTTAARSQSAGCWMPRGSHHLLAISMRSNSKWSAESTRARYRISSFDQDSRPPSDPRIV